MHISSIEYTAFKGQSASHALTPATLVVGPNGAGKTTLKQVIQLAILGFIPGRAKNNRDPFPNGSVKVTFDDGEFIKRRYTCKGGSIKEAIETSLADPDIEVLATPTLDSAEYFNLGPTHQVQYIFARMEMPDTHTPAGIIADVKGTAFPDHAAELVEEAMQDACGMTTAEISHYGIAEGLAKLVGDKGTIGAQLAYYNKRAKDTIGNLRVSSELRARAGECSAETLADIRAKIASNDTLLAEANNAAGALMQKRMAANKTVLRRKELEAALARPAVDHADAIASLKEEVDALTEQYKPAPSVTQSHYEDNLRRRATAMAALEVAQIALFYAEEAEQGFAALTECPTCKSKAKGWKQHVSRDLAEKASAARLAKTKSDETFAHVDQAYDEAHTEFAAAKAITQHNAELAAKTANKHRQIERLTYEQGTDANVRKSFADELAHLGAPEEVELGEAATRVQELQGIATQLSTKLDAVTRLAHEIKQAALGEQEHAKALAYVAVFDATKKKLKARQVSTIDALFQGLIEKANYFTAGILAEPLIFRDGEIGRIVGNEFVSHKDFSGAEQGLTYVAVAAALAASSPFKLAIIDEVKIDPANTVKVMERLRDAIEAGVINQAIMLDTVRTDVAGWSQIALSGGSK